MRAPAAFRGGGRGGGRGPPGGRGGRGGGRGGGGGGRFRDEGPPAEVIGVFSKKSSTCQPWLY